MAEIKKVTNGMTGSEAAQTLYDNDNNLNAEIAPLAGLQSKFFAVPATELWNYRDNNPDLTVQIESLFNHIGLVLYNDLKKPSGEYRNIHVRMADVNAGTYRAEIVVEQPDGTARTFRYSNTQSSGVIKFDSGIFYFSLNPGSVPTNGTKGMTAAQSSLDQSIIRQASFNLNVPIIDTSLNKINYSNRWTYNPAKDPIRIADMFKSIRIILNDSLTINNRNRRLYIEIVENLSQQYRVRLRVEQADGTFKAFNKTGNQTDNLVFDQGVIYYSLAHYSGLPTVVNTPATYEQGAINEEYVNLIQNSFISSLTEEGWGSIFPCKEISNYPLVPSAVRSAPRFYVSEPAQSSDRIIKTVNINGAQKGLKIQMIEVHKPAHNVYNFLARSEIIEFDGTSDYASVNDFRIGRLNRIGVQVVEGSVKIGISDIPPDAVRYGVYAGDVTDRDGLGPDDAVYNGDYLLFGASESEPALLLKSRYYDSVIPMAAPYSQVARSSSPENTYLGNPITLRGPYGYDMFLHPNVLYFENGLFGYKYWMTVTPFPTIAPRYPDFYENPCVYASNNGLDWGSPAPNPIDALEIEHAATSGYMSDPCLCLRGNTLECWYRRTPAGPSYDPNYTTELLRKTTTDGVNWSEREVMVEGMTYNDGMIRAPRIYWDGNKYICYRSGNVTGNRPNLYRSESQDGKVWINDILCTGMTDSNVHADVLVYNGVYYAILHHTFTGQKLILYTSEDGINFSNRLLLLEPDDLTFYRDGFYKSTIVHNNRDFLVYFTALDRAASGNIVRKIGLMKGKTLDSLVPVDAKGVGSMNINGFLNLDCSENYSAKIKLDDNKYIAYDKTRGMIISIDQEGNSKPLFKV